MGKKRHRGRPAKDPAKQPGAKPLPEGFHLGKMNEVDPGVVLRRNGDDPLGATMLMLAVAFNDLRDSGATLTEALEIGQQHERGTKEYAAAAGRQWYAMRQMTAISHETLELIKDRKKSLELPEFRAVLDQFPDQDIRDQWKDIVAAASSPAHTTKDGTPRSFRAWLKTIRNEAVWHYAKPDRIVDGFRTFFFENDDPTPESEQASFAVGKAMRETRFCYADAAMMSAIIRFPVERDENAEFLTVFNRVIKHVILAFIHYRLQERAADATG